MLNGQVVAADCVGHHANVGQLIELPIGDHAGFVIRQIAAVTARDFRVCANVVE